MGCNSCHRGVGSPSPGAPLVFSSIVDAPQASTPASNFPMPPFVDPPWYTTPVGIFGIALAFLGVVYYVKKRPA